MNAAQTLAAAYAAFATAAGHDWHIQNAKEHVEAADGPAYDADATRSAIKSLADMLYDGAQLEAEPRPALDPMVFAGYSRAK